MNIVSLIQNETHLEWRQMLKCVWALSIPAILAHVTYIIMEYIDAAMVGSLGAAASASIGLVGPLLWLTYGLCSATVQGFSVQVAQFIGAKNLQKSRDTFRQGLIFVVGFSLVLSGIGIWFSPDLPLFLGATPEIYQGAYEYFLVFMIGLPIIMLRILATSMLQSSGSMKSVSFFNSIMCVLDILFNFYFIFPTRYISVAGLQFWLPGAGYGVMGAAIGTITAEAVTAGILLYLSFMRANYLRQKAGMAWHVTKKCMVDAFKISTPIAAEQCILSGSHVAMMLMVAPLGTVAIAANSFAITAESLCYMPGMGIAIAAVTLVGQSIGARKPDFARGFAKFSVAVGMVTMGLLALLMYIVAPYVFAFLTPVAEVQEMGTEILRIALYAEGFFAIPIVGAGALRGARDTFYPSLINLASVWGIRIPLAYFLVSQNGIHGIWWAMCIELYVRALLFALRLYKQKWNNRGSME